MTDTGENESGREKAREDGRRRHKRQRGENIKKNTTNKKTTKEEGEIHSMINYLDIMLIHILVKLENVSICSCYVYSAIKCLLSFFYFSWVVWG